jgi:hypothetical protein
VRASLGTLAHDESNCAKLDHLCASQKAVAGLNDVGFRHGTKWSRLLTVFCRTTTSSTSNSTRPLLVVYLYLLPFPYINSEHTTKEQQSWLFAHSLRIPTSEWLKLSTKYYSTSFANAGAHRVGVFSTLTNAYAIVAVGASENFYRYVYLHSPRHRRSLGNAQNDYKTDIYTAFSKLNSKTSYPSATPQ